MSVINPSLPIPPPSPLAAGSRRLSIAFHSEAKQSGNDLMSQPDLNKLAEHYSEILKEIGADMNAEGLRETPLRAAKALVEMTEGSRMGTDQLAKMFRAECQTAICHDMVIVEGIKEVGLCEHHLLPILMNITIAYVPGKKILGLSKVSRIAGYFARRLQNQERTAHLIATFIEGISPINPSKGGREVFPSGACPCIPQARSYPMPHIGSARCQ